MVSCKHCGKDTESDSGFCSLPCITAYLTENMAKKANISDAAQNN